MPLITDESFDLEIFLDSLRDRLRGLSTENISRIVAALAAGTARGIEFGNTGNDPPETTAVLFSRPVESWEDLERDFTWWIALKRRQELVEGARLKYPFGEKNGQS